ADSRTQDTIWRLGRTERGELASSTQADPGCQRNEWLRQDHDAELHQWSVCADSRKSSAAWQRHYRLAGGTSGKGGDWPYFPGAAGVPAHDTARQSGRIPVT